MIWLLPTAVLADVPNGDFSEGEVGHVPEGWALPSPSIEAGLDAALTDHGTLLLRSPRGDHWGTVMASVPAETYREQRVQLRLRVRVSRGSAQIWLREDTEDNRPGFFDNMSDRPLSGSNWQDVVLTAPLGPATTSLALGVLVEGRARVEIDDVELAVLGPADEGNQPARRLAESELKRLVALARLGAAVEFFHPTRAVMDADWSRVMTAAVRKVEGEEDALTGLGMALASVAPAVQVFQGTDPGPGECGGRVSRVEHTGLGALFNPGLEALYPPPFAIYRSRLLRERARHVPEGERASVIDLGDGMKARVPLALCDEHRAAGTPRIFVQDTPEGWEPSDRDRSSRLAAVMRTWAVYELFYPYWDVVDGSWSQALEHALQEASEGEDLELTLNRLIAKADDGHGAAWGRGPAQAQLPIEVVYTERGLTVSRERVDGPLQVGDIIVDPNLLERARALEQQTSAATEQWRQHRVSEDVLLGPPLPQVIRVLRDDRVLELTVQPRSWSELADVPGGHPANGSEVGPGIVYLDLDHLDDLSPFLPALRAARGVVFDLRGYPGEAAKDALRLLADQWLHCPIWLVPVLRSPTMEPDWNEQGRWWLRPARRGLDAPAVFLTGGGAISWAETVMTMVEAYALAPIVGGPTAGTNGNVNAFVPLAGYEFQFTGMKVLKNDGSRFHGVGIQPTLLVQPTWEGISAGRDEVLEAGIGVLVRELGEEASELAPPEQVRAQPSTLSHTGSATTATTR